MVYHLLILYYIIVWPQRIVKNKIYLYKSLMTFVILNRKQNTTTLNSQTKYFTYR